MLQHQLLLLLRHHSLHLSLIKHASRIELVLVPLRHHLLLGCRGLQIDLGTWSLKHRSCLKHHRSQVLYRLRWRWVMWPVLSGVLLLRWLRRVASRRTLLGPTTRQTRDSASL